MAGGAAMACSSPATRAAAVPWTNPAGGFFDDLANWNAGAGPVPGFGDDAQFSLDAAYTATLRNSPNTSALSVSAGDVTLIGDIFPRTYAVASTSVTGGKLTLGSSPVPFTLQYINNFSIKGGGSVLVNSGNDVTTTSNGSFALATAPGPTPDSIASLVVNGGGTTFAVVGGTSIGPAALAQMTFSNNATGSFRTIFSNHNSNRFAGVQLTIASGADVTVGNGSAGNGYMTLNTLGGHALQNNFLTVTGAGSTLNQDGGFFSVGGGAPFAFTVTDGGTVTTSSGGYSFSANANATVDITGGTWNARGQIYLSGGTFKRTDATGTLNWPDGFKGISVTSGGTFDWFGPLTFAVPGLPYTMNLPVTGANSKMLTSGQLTVGERMKIGVGTGGLLAPASLSVGGPGGIAAEVSVDGAGSALNTGVATFGGPSLTALLAFTNNATGHFTGALTLRTGSQGGASIASGADVTAAGDISVGGLTGSSTTFHINGAGSTLTQTGEGAFSVGQGATVIVDYSAVLTTGNGTMTVTDGGLVSANSSGTLAVNGDISVGNGGSINGLTTWAAGRSMSVTANGLVYAAPLSFGFPVQLSGNTINVSGVAARFFAMNVEFNGQTTASFTAGGRGGYSGVFRIGSDGTGGHVTVDGAASSIGAGSTTGTSIVGAASGAAATLDILNGAQLGMADGGKLLVKSTGSVNIASNNVRIATLAVDGGAFNIDSGAVSVDAMLSIINGGELTMSEQAKLIVRGGTLGTSDGATYDGITGMIQSGRAGGAWNGGGINTDDPDAAGGLTAIGIALADDVGYVGGTFGGVSVATGDVLAMYTYAGDANLDGLISGDDYSALDFASGITGADSWSNGDFNYDGVLSGDDYSTIDFNLVAQGAPFPTGWSTATPSGASAVPEPTCAMIMTFTAAGLLGRRRR